MVGAALRGRPSDGLTYRSSANQRRSIHFVNSSTGDTVNAAPMMITQSHQGSATVPKVISNSGTYSINASITSSHRIARLSHLFANGWCNTESRSERKLYALKN